MWALGAGPDPAGMTCDRIIKGYEKNKLLASPEGGRSKKHRKNSAVRVKELESFYTKCVEGSAPGGSKQIDLEQQVAIDRIFETGGAGPATASSVFARGPVRQDHTVGWIALGVGALLFGAWMLTRKRRLPQ